MPKPTDSPRAIGTTDGLPPRRPLRGSWATTALLAGVALVLAAGCGSRLDQSEIRAGVAGSSLQGSGSGSGAGSSTGSDGSGSTGAGSGTGTSDGGPAAVTTGETAATATTGTGTVGGSTSTTGATTGATSGTATGSTAGGTTGPAGTTSTTTTGATTGAPTGAQSVGTPNILGGSGPCAPATKSAIKIGNVSTLSGVLGELFSPVVPALNLFVKSQNACGGLNGHVIKLITSDDQGDPSTAVTAVSRQIKNDKVLAFVGNIQVLTVDAIVPIVTAAQIPIIGADITNDTWFTNPYLFPQGGSPQAVAYGYHDIAKNVAKKPKDGNVYCLEVPVACKNINDAFGDLAGVVGTQILLQKQVSITAPSYTSQCLEFQSKGVQSLALTIDAASIGRFASSCEGLRPPYIPQYIAYPLAVGNERQFFGGGKVLAGTYVPLTTFGWMQNDTPATKYYQDSIAKYGFSGATGNAASLGWTAGALLVAASGKIEDNPTTQQILDGLYTIKDNNLGGLSAPKLTFTKGKNPRVQYCYYVVRSNTTNTGWEKPTSKPTCTNTRSKRDPNQ